MGEVEQNDKFVDFVFFFVTLQPKRGIQFLQQMNYTITNIYPNLHLIREFAKRAFIVYNHLLRMDDFHDWGRENSD